MENLLSDHTLQSIAQQCTAAWVMPTSTAVQLNLGTGLPCSTPRDANPIERSAKAQWEAEHDVLRPLLANDPR